jgi:hypothetical protein
MKFKILALLLVAFVTSSCKKLLEPDPNKTGSSLAVNFYIDYAGALQGINGIYASTRDVYRNIWPLDELSDDSYGGTNRQTIEENNLLPNDGIPGSLFTSSYQAIGRINIFLARVPNIANLSVNENILRNQFVGEAKTLRALHYFNLVRLFGEVPLVLDEQTDIEALDVPRASVAAVYAQIQKDLTEAIAVLPASHPNTGLVQPIPASLTGGREKGRVTSILAKAILGHAYLTLKDFVNADLHLSQAVSDAAANGVVLNNIYSQNFEALGGPELSNESLFEAAFVPIATLPGAQHAFPAFFGPPEDNPTGVAAFNWNAPTDKAMPAMENLNNTLAQAFLPGDLRKASTIKYNTIEYPATATTPRSINAKFWVRGQGNQGSSNWPIYRLADVILLAAEAKQGNNQEPAALELLNRVHAHSRTGLTAYVGLTGDALRNAIRLERRVELALEGKRYFDLLRWGNLATVMAAHGSPVINVQRNGLLPIPQGEREKNPNLTQNPGY